MSNKLSPTIIRLLIANMSYRSAAMIMKIFLNIFILKLTGDIKIVAIFLLLAACLHTISYFGASYILKYGYRNIAHYIAMFGSTAMFLSLAIQPELIGVYYIQYGIIHGIVSGVYWSVYNMNQFDFTLQKNRGNYEGLKKSLRTMVGIGVPVIIGAIIVWNPGGLGYQVSFSIAALGVLLCGIFGTIDESKIVISKTRIELGKYFTRIKNFPDFWKIFMINILIGFALSVPLIEVLLPLILYNDGYDEAKVGLVISITSIISIIISYIFGKYISYKYYKKVFMLGALIYILFISAVIIASNQIFVYAFIPVVTILYIVIDIPRSVFVMNVLHRIDNYEEYKFEHVLVSEMSIMLGRISVFVFLLWAGNLQQETVISIFTLMAIAMAISLILFTTTKNLKSHV